MRKAWLRRNIQARLKNAQPLPYVAASDTPVQGLFSTVPPAYAGPFAEVGRQTFDGEGNTDATATAKLTATVEIHRLMKETI